MDNINDLPKSVRERIEELKEKDIFLPEELQFLKSRISYLTEKEKERISPKEVKKEKKVRK